MGYLFLIWLLAALSIYGLLGLGSQRTLLRSKVSLLETRQVGLNALLASLKYVMQKLPFAQGAQKSAVLRRQCDEQMPEFLDVLALGLSAGLSFDASLGLYCSRSSAPLAEELGSTMLTWQMGLRSRSEALEELAERIGAVSLKRFCRSVCEALSFGAPLAATLERQADLMREEQRASTQERIEEVPVRMLIPLGLLIVPAMLLAILGPLLSGAFAN